METMVIDRKILPEPISSRISSDRVRVSEEGGNIALVPIPEESNAEKLGLNELYGLRYITLVGAGCVSDVGQRGCDALATA